MPKVTCMQPSILPGSSEPTTLKPERVTSGDRAVDCGMQNGFDRQRCLIRGDRGALPFSAPARLVVATLPGELLKHRLRVHGHGNVAVYWFNGAAPLE